MRAQKFPWKGSSRPPRVLRSVAVGAMTVAVFGFSFLLRALCYISKVFGQTPRRAPFEGLTLAYFHRFIRDGKGGSFGYMAVELDRVHGLGSDTWVVEWLIFSNSGFFRHSSRVEGRRVVTFSGRRLSDHEVVLWLPRDFKEDHPARVYDKTFRAESPLGDRYMGRTLKCWRLSNWEGRDERFSILYDRRTLVEVMTLNNGHDEGGRYRESYELIYDNAGV